jgi:O-antigen ligase
VGNLEKTTQSGVTVRAAKYLSSSSVLVRLVKPVTGFVFSFEGIIAIICGAVFCIPHEMWNNLFGLAASVVMLLLAIIAAICKKDKISVRPDRLWLSFILFVFASVFSTVFSMNRGDSLRVFAFFATSFIMYAAVRIIASGEDGRRRMLFVMYVVTIATAVYAVYQGIVGVEADPSLTDLTLNSDMPGRVFSTFGNPNNYAEFIVLFLPFSVVFALNAKSVIGKLVLFAPLSVVIAALMQTYSRSGWIAFAVAAVVFIVLYNKKLIPLLVLAAIVAVPFLPATVMDRILTIGNLSDSSSSYRIIIWQGCLDMLKDWWVSGLGLGPGAFSTVYPFYSYGISSVAPHSHMQFMEMLIELGIFGFISYIWFMFELIKRSCMGSKHPDKSKANISIACAAAVTGLVFVGLFEYCWFYPRVMLAFFVAGAMGAQDNEKQNLEIK